MLQNLIIDELKEHDWQQVKSIFIEGINTGNATFQTSASTWEEWDVAHQPDCRLVARLNGEVVGWVALSPISSRKAFKGVAEVSVYVSQRATGMGIGRRLIQALIDNSEHHGYWTLQAMIFPENIGSIKLHMKNGLEKVGTRKQMGKLNGIWRDVVLLERRSEINGK